MTRTAPAASIAVVALLTFTAAPAAWARDSFGGEAPHEASLRPGSGRGCALFTVAAARSTADDCTGCHSQAEHASHPVEVDYARAQRGGGMMARDLRTVAELQRRGIRLVAGKVTCVTCHDARSRAASKLALPEQAVVTAAIDLHNRSSYAQPAVALRLADMPAGTAVSPTALCKSCHGMD